MKNLNKFTARRQQVTTALFALLLAISFTAATAQSPAVKQWDARFGGNDNDDLSTLQQTTDGGYILGGYSISDSSGDKTQDSWQSPYHDNTFDYWIVKTDSTGTRQWDARFGGNDLDELNCLQQTSDGGYMLGGWSESDSNSQKSQNTWPSFSGYPTVDYWIVKTDAHGVKQWDKRYGGNGDDFLHSIQQTSDGGYILGGYSNSDNGDDKTQDSWQGTNGDNTFDYWIVKIDANGVKQWDARYGGSDIDELTIIQQTNDGGYILGGYSYSDSSGDKTQDSWNNNSGDNTLDYWILKTDGNGVKQWDARFGGNDIDELTTIQQTSDGYILGGFSYSDSSGDKTQDNWGLSDYWIVKTDANGVKQWDARFGGDDQDVLWNLLQSPDGGYILGGGSASDSGGDKTQNSQGNFDYWLVKTDANGIQQWDVRFGGNNWDVTSDLQQTTDGGYILGGGSKSDISGDKTQDCWHEANGDPTNDYWIVKVLAGDSNVIYYADADGDGYGNSAITSSDPLPGYVTNAMDCDDANAAINPNSIELCNGIDDNCNGLVDEYCNGCPNVSGIVVSEITDHSARISWDEVNATDVYKIRYKFNAQWADWSQVARYQPTVKIKGLTPNLEYVYEVKVLCNINPNQVSDWSYPQYFNTLPQKQGAEMAAAAAFDIFPNPANDAATIGFTLAATTHVNLALYNVNGQVVQHLMDATLDAGNHTLALNTSQLAKGVYLLQLITNSGVTNRKLVVQ